MKVQEAHLKLSSFSEKNAGIGISIELVKRLIDVQIARLNSYYSNINANQDFQSINVSFSGVFVTNQRIVKFEDYVNPNEPSEFFPTLNIENIQIKIFGYLDKKKVVEILVDYSSIVGIIQLINKRLKISLFNENHQETDFIKLWETDQSLKEYFEDNYNFVEETWNQLTIHFKATSIFSGRDIAEAFVDSLDIPDIFKVFNGIKFGEDGKIGADSTGELLMFTADSSLNFSNCPTYNPSGQTQIKSIVKDNDGNKYTIGELQGDKSDVVVETEIDPDSPSMDYPVGNGDDDGTERLRTGDVFLFTPIDLLRINFDVVKPSINASDSGRFGPIYWRYSVTAAVQKIALKLIRKWPMEFRLSVPTLVFGQAGAGVKIGCIRYEALGAMFDGEVNPLDINFKIYLDWSRMQIVFVSKIESVKGKNFRFRSFPRLRFPISEIIDFILGEASKYVVEQQADKVLTVTRIPIANLKILEKVASIIPRALAGETDSDGNVTMGVKFKK